jgi:hypothetical protein
MIVNINKDAFIYNNINANFGSEVFANAYYYPDTTPTVERILLSFDLLGISPPINTIDLYIYRQNAGVDELFVHKLNRDFIETEVTWTNASASTPWATPGGDFDPAPIASIALTDTGWARITVPVSAILSGKLNLILLVKESGSSSLVRIATREAGANVPYLDINAIPKTGILDVTSVPTGSKIYVDGIDTLATTRATIALSEGTHTLKLALTGYLDLTDRDIVITEGQTTVKNYTLTPTPTKGQLSISTVPIGAEVYLNGIDTGYATPIRLIDLAPATYTVTLKKQKYEDLTDNAVVVSAGQITAKEYTLTALNVGTLQISSDPSEADVYIDDEATPSHITPVTIDLAPGDYKVKVVKDNLSYNTTVTIVAGGTIVIEATLIAAPVPSSTTTEGTSLVAPLLFAGVMVGLTVGGIMISRNRRRQ